MKTNKIQKYMSAVLMIGASMLWSSCTDTWNEHYDPNQSQVGQGSLLSHIAEDPTLANFYHVLDTIGATESLNSPQQFTVWAPTSLTSEQADSIIRVFREDEQKGIKWEENRAVTQFLQNHTALYSRPVSAFTDDTLKMLSKKYMQLKGRSSEEGTINGIPFYGMLLCNNGILYKTDQVLTFFPNVREYVDREAEYSNLSDFLALYDEYTLDEKASVPGDIIDGKQHYLDSVTYLSNDFLRQYGYINREDSLYKMVVPTNEVWDNLYKKYSEYYNFATNVEHADSLKMLYTSMNIMQGRFFNVSKTSSTNFHLEDSICNTRYNVYQEHSPRKNVYYNPLASDGILGQLEKITCSNGDLYVDNIGVIDPRTTFFDRKDYEASYSAYYKIPTNSTNEPTMNVSRMVYQKRVLKPVLDGEGNPVLDEEGNPVMEMDDDATDKGHRYNYVEVTAKSTSSQTELEYMFPNLLSGCYYNIYMVTVPNQTKLPTYYDIRYTTMNEKGVHSGNGTYFENPTPFVKGQYEPDPSIGLTQEEIAGFANQSNLQRAYRSNPLDVDTILVATGFQIPYSGYGLNEESFRLKLSSFGPGSTAIREKVYTRMFTLNEFIFVPFETKEEADAAKFDLDAINDAILQANRKK